ncbi:MAG: hypothetical protein Q8908_16460, partial [Bacteroidota bacterium]|nr:hypothetical protein [Bacteroidota bacterium]
MELRKLFLPVLIMACGIVSGEQVNTDKPLNNQQVRSSEFEVNIGDHQIFAEQFKDINYSMFEFKTAIPVTIKFNGEIHDYEISPKQLKINGTRQGSRILFELNKTGYYVVTVNKTRRLFLFV